MTDLEHLGEQHAAALKEYDRRMKDLETLRREVQDAQDYADEAYDVLKSVGDALLNRMIGDRTNA